MTSSSILTLCSAISVMGWQRVVSVGRMYSERARPSIAMTEQSPGTSMPLSESAFMAEMAMASDMLKSAGKSAPESASFAAAA